MDPVTLSASGNPAGTTTGFSTNPVTPPGASTLTIGNTGAASAGSYNMTVSATSTSGPKSAGVVLNLYTAAAGQPTLTSPANGATNVAALPNLPGAAAPHAGAFNVDVATDAGITDIVASANRPAGASVALWDEAASKNGEIAVRRALPMLSGFDLHLFAETPSAAEEAVRVVRHGIARSRASLRIATSSKKESFPRGVFTTSWISPLIIRSTTFGRPSFTLRTGIASRPAALRNAAVPEVAKIRKPRLRSSRAWLL